jgi:NTP pyrophosphatase (non-canonical NTP hydrolase)
MEFNIYQEQAIKTAIYPQTTGMMYLTVGLAGEAGEVCNKIKKIIRDKQGIISFADRRDIMHELGDVLWYLSALANEFDLTLDQVAEQNLVKLTDRKSRGVLNGSGNER